MDTRTVVDPSTVVVRGLVAGVVSGSAVGALLGAYVLFGLWMSGGGEIGDGLVGSVVGGIIGGLLGGVVGFLVGAIAVVLLIAASRLLRTGWQARLAAAGAASLAGSAVLVGATTEVTSATLGFGAVCGGLGLAVGRRVVFGARGAP